MLVNWKIEYCDKAPKAKQPPDYYMKGNDYWFYRYFMNKPEVDVIDIRSFPWLEKFEKNKLRFYVIQAVRAIPRLYKYDLIVSHGMQSGVVICLWRKLFKRKAKHIAFDIGSFASASESGFPLRLMQFASKSIDGIIYHTSSQIEYYKKYFPWIVKKSQFMRFGTDLEYFNPSGLCKTNDFGTYMICVGYTKRDWGTVIDAYRHIDTKIKLRLVGHAEDKYQGIEGVEQIPFVPIRDLMNQIYNARFCVLPLEDFNYSFGQMTLMQQMALGKCVLAARVSSLSDYIEDGKNALFYEARNIKDLSEKMKQLIQDAGFAEYIGKQARQYLRDKCNEEIMANNIERFFEIVSYSKEKK